MALDPKKWTLKTSEAVAAAIDQAKSLSNPELTPDHLLASMMRQEDTIIPAVLAKLQREAGDRTSHLRPFERITRVRLLPEAFTPENGFLTPTLKMRRHVIAERLAAEIEEAYA